MFHLRVNSKLKVICWMVLLALASIAQLSCIRGPERQVSFDPDLLELHKVAYLQDGYVSMEELETMSTYLFHENLYALLSTDPHFVPLQHSYNVTEQRIDEEGYFVKIEWKGRSFILEYDAELSTGRMYEVSR